VPYRLLHHVYRAADIYVTAAYAESFAHPLVEAMSTGLPIVASDLAVHREICRTAAMYFDRFSPRELADQIERMTLREWRKRTSEESKLRSGAFSWRTHVEQIVAIAGKLIR
jgi:glycosyltransferase involved in cell wall biosynthesis